MRAMGYGSYRGDGKLRKILKGAAIFLAVVLALCLVGIFLLQRYIVYTADGPRLDLPFLHPPVESPSPGPSVEAPPAGTVVVEQTEPTPESTPEPENLRLIFLPREVMFSGLAEAKLSIAGAAAAVYDMKADGGDLGYVSGLDLAVRAKTSAADVSLGAAITAYTRDAAYTVARVSCFKDHKLSNADAALNVTTNSGYRWTDPDGLRWASPTVEAVREYLIEVCVELAQLGFDEILLDNAGYPPSGNLHYIKKGPLYDAAQLETVIGDFYTQMKEALAPYDVRLAVMTDEGTLTAGVNRNTGQSAANLALADRIYLETTDLAPYLEIMRAAGLEDPERNVVAIVAAPLDGAVCWAVKEEV